MYLINVYRDKDMKTIQNYLAVSMDSTNKLAVLNIDMQPFIVEGDEGVKTFSSLEHIIAVFEDTYEPCEVGYCEVESLFDLGAIKHSQMKFLYK